MAATVVTTPCKVNLHLGVHHEKDARGYHLVDSVMVPVDLCDDVVVDDAPELTVRFSPPLEIPAEKTGVWKAATWLAEALGVEPLVSIEVTARIPERAGLGGSSADAGATLRALAARWGVSPLDPRVTAVARHVGADVSFFLDPRPALFAGAGDVRVRTFPDIEMPLALVMPRAEGGSTVAAYAETLPNVVYSTSTMYACAQDTLKAISEAITEHNLNRVVVASCTPRTHEPLFREA